jgi:hypothetical protein
MPEDFFDPQPVAPRPADPRPVAPRPADGSGSSKGTPRILIPRGAWRVFVVNQAQRLEDDLSSLDHAPSDAQASLIRDSLARARLAATRPDKSAERLRDWWSGVRPQAAWAALHEAGQRLLELQSNRAVSAQIPEIIASVSVSLKDDDPRALAYTKELETYEKKAPEGLSENDRAAISRIKRTVDAASDTAHGNVRAYRNLLVLLGIGLSAVLVIIALLHAFVPSFLSFKPPAGQDAPEVWAIEVAGAFGGVIAAVLALTRLEGITGPYGLPGYQALLRIPMAGAVSLFGIVLMESGTLSALKPVYGLELFAYGILFGYAQEPLLRMIDKQAASILEPARSKDDPAGPAPKPPAPTS